MKYLEAFLGKAVLALFVSLPLQGHTTEVDYQPAFYHEYNWSQIGLWAGIGSLAIIGLAQFSKSEILFASAYGFAGFYYLREEVNHRPQFEYEDYVLPVGLAAMALANLTLLQKDEESTSTIATTNIIGSGLLATYWYYYYGPGEKAWALPWTDGKSYGVALNSSF